MRNLTIKRNKRFSACLAKFKIYVEDYENPDLAIGEVPCRKLGDIKNGEEKTFTVDNGSVKVFVIADLASKDYCNEFYQLPEGETTYTFQVRQAEAIPRPSAPPSFSTATRHPKCLNTADAARRKAR